MTGILLAMKSLSDLFETMKKLKDMEKETKTITMPYSDFLVLQDKASKYMKTEKQVHEELEMNYKDTIKRLQEEYEKYYEKYRKSENENDSLKRKINSLESKIILLKSRRWWEIWKR